MLFITFLDILPGQYTKAIRAFKNPTLSPTLSIKQSLWMFGKPDAIIIFEAENEQQAGEFVVQFGEVAAVKTSLVFPIENMRWTNIR
jgi:hypothetical protein